MSKVLGVHHVTLKDGVTGEALEQFFQIGTEFGLDWSRWKQLIQVIEEAGFAGLYLSDHFARQGVGKNALELITALTYLADHTERVHFGPLVSPFTFRDPVMLARQAIALDDLSGGRMILGLGSGRPPGHHHRRQPETWIGGPQTGHHLPARLACLCTIPARVGNRDHAS
jgi:alkanesulfonate monooxygenase SsuD/methylene tetrahydromethanopterin reductase-like flavin-dependent oxidoreductase (luciferase family)